MLRLCCQYRGITITQQKKRPSQLIFCDNHYTSLSSGPDLVILQSALVEKPHRHGNTVKLQSSFLYSFAYFNNLSLSCHISQKIFCFLLVLRHHFSSWRWHVCQHTTLSHYNHGPLTLKGKEIGVNKAKAASSCSPSQSDLFVDFCQQALQEC